MFYLTKETHIDTHTNQPPLSLPTFFSPLPSPIVGEHALRHTHTQAVYIQTVIIKHTHTLTHTQWDQPAAICSTHSVQSLQNTLFTTIHQITSHSLNVRALCRRRLREDGGKHNSYCSEEETREELASFVNSQSKLKSIILHLGDTRLSEKLPHYYQTCDIANPNTDDVYVTLTKQMAHLNLLPVMFAILFFCYFLS